MSAAATRRADDLGPPATGHPEVTAFFNRRTFSLQYVVADPQTGACAVVDSAGS